ncbi:MAG: hypothetical protein COA36_16865 [Desulfotalea sp.]|nr:MAG: hypothetical protein COA36_16865 [Desulfotalea sp.]
MKICLIKGLDNKFSIAYPSDYEVARKLKAGKEYYFEVKNSRNIKFLRKFFALMKVVYENQEVYNNMDHLRRDLTVSAGFYTTRVTIKGETVIEAESISFSKMDAVQFSEFYDRILDEIIKYFPLTKEGIAEYIDQYY